jgi:membrane dipeptidase
MTARGSGAVPIADAHSDLLLELVHAPDPNPLRSRWLAPLERGGVALQVCAIYVEPRVPPPRALRDALRLALAFHGGVSGNGSRVVQVRTADDLDRLGDGRIGLLLALEGAGCLGMEPELIDVFDQLGVRMASLTWNSANAFAGGCGTGRGLRPLGAALVDRMVALGMIVDLAHASEPTFWDVLARVPEHPVLVSHAACRALYDHPRNLSDAQLRALRDAGGVIGVMPHPLVIDPERADLDRVVDHIDHAVEVAGIAHVGLGGDFLRQIARALDGQGVDTDGLPSDAAIEGLEGPEDYPALVAKLRTRGYGDAALRALTSGNLLRLLRRVLSGRRDAT